jgi:hypothetical protein
LPQKFEFLKTCKKSNTGPLCISDPECGGHDQEIWSFNQFLSQTCDLRENSRLTPMDFEQKFDIFKTCKKSNTKPLCISDLEYGGHDQEIWSFRQFLPQTGDLL